MRIEVADAETSEPTGMDKREHLRMVCNDRLRHGLHR